MGISVNLKSKFTIAAVFLFLLIAIFVFAIPSLIGFLLTCLIIAAAYDLFMRRQRLAARSLNLALRAACHRKASISKIATAFARYGPLRGPCYEYARRLMVGEDPVHAAAASRVPLQLGTAVAMSTTSQAAQVASQDDVDQPYSSAGSSALPAYSQILYLTMAATITCVVLTFVTVSILPGIEQMIQEFGVTMEPYEWLIVGTTPTWIAITVMVLILLMMIPILARTDHFTIPILNAFRLSPLAAQSRADILEGLADATEAGMPLSRAIEIAGQISLKSNQRWSFQNASHLIQQGASAADALYQNGWINGEEVIWLRDAPPLRFAQLLRHFGRQGIRDAQANLQWLMGILFPVMVVLLGIAVLSYAYGFLGTIMQLITLLA